MFLYYIFPICGHPCYSFPYEFGRVHLVHGSSPVGIVHANVELIVLYTDLQLTTEIAYFFGKETDHRVPLGVQTKKALLI